MLPCDAEGRVVAPEVVEPSDAMDEPLRCFASSMFSTQHSLM